MKREMITHPPRTGAPDILKGFIVQFARNSAGDFFRDYPMAMVHASDSVKEHRERFVSGEKKINIEIFSPAIDGTHPTVLVLHGAGGLLLDEPAMRRFARALLTMPHEQSVFSKSISRNKTRAIAARISHGLAREPE